MIIKLVGSGAELENLENLVIKSLTELGVTENPALCIEEESIDFKDMIFQWEVPEYDEIKSMFISILGDDDAHEGGGCSTGGGCGTGGCGSCGDEENTEGGSSYGTGDCH